MIKKILKIKISFLLVACLLLFSIINGLLLYLFLPGPLATSQIIIIEPKLSIIQISKKLDKEQIINYSQIFCIVAKFYSLNQPLKSGEYVFTTRISPWQVLSILSSGKSIIHKMVIPEGILVNEILEKISLEDRLFGEIKSKVPEGFLMPSTYYYSYGDQKEKIIDQMRTNMSAALDLVMQKLTSDSPLKTRLDVLTLASIVEKEARLDHERPLIAAVFLNRLKIGMKLQADPTTAYGVTEGKYNLRRPLTSQDLKSHSPYNTYYVTGLPPTPIACPGLKSLQAVVSPAITKALYFVVNGEGGHNFSDNLDEHNKNVKNYRQKNKESK